MNIKRWTFLNTLLLKETKREYHNICFDKVSPNMRFKDLKKN